MKRILVSFLIAALLSGTLLGGCGKSENRGSAEEETEAAEEMTSEEASYDEEADDEEDNESDNRDGGLFSKAGSDDKDDASGSSTDGLWQKAYLDYLKDNPAGDGAYTYALIYVDDDDIPEMVVDTGFEAGGCQIATWHDGVTDVLQTARLYFTYIERKNLLNNSEGHMGYYYDNIYSIKDGKWKEVFIGEYSDFDDNAEPEYNEETGRIICTEYLVNGKETDEKGYYKALKEVYDLSAGKDPSPYLTYDDLISYLENGRFIFQDHSYKLFVGDCTWEEARRACEKKGGYLACMTCDEEFKKVEDLIRSEDKTNYCFYVGGIRDDKYSWIWIEPNLTQNSCLNSVFYDHWLEGGPSYKDTLPDGTEIDERYVELLYRKSEDRFYLNDVTNDVPGVYPSYRGRIGYICEFDE